MSLAERLTETVAAVEALLGDEPIDRADSLRSLPAERVLALARMSGELTRIVGSIGAVVSSELTHRVQTDTDFRRVALGGDVGGRLASELLRELTRLDDDTLTAWERVGDAIAPRTSLHGEPLPRRHEAIAGAVLGAELTAVHAAIVVRGIDVVADRTDVATLDALEHTLVDYAASLTTRQLGKLVRQLPDRFDVDGAEPREQLLRERSRITIRNLPNGMTRVVAELHPVAAGLFTTVMDAHTAPRRQPAFADAADPGSLGTGSLDTAGAHDPIMADLRPLAQRRVDAFETIMREALRHDTGSLAGTAVTMLVTVTLDELRTGLGAARISGVDEPISAATARRLAADAELIPVVLGGDSEVLDLGRSARLFSEPQRRAMVARDGGCVWPGCQAPPSWCEAAHLEPWLPHGPTDLDNGALMCSAHHHRFDRDGWSLRRIDGIPHLIPPPWLDPRRAPRRAGRLPVLVA